MRWWLVVVVVLGDDIVRQKRCVCKKYIKNMLSVIFYIYIDIDIYLHLDTWENMNITLLLVGTVMFLK